MGFIGTQHAVPLMGSRHKFPINYFCLLYADMPCSRKMALTSSRSLILKNCSLTMASSSKRDSICKIRCFYETRSLESNTMSEEKPIVSNELIEELLAPEQKPDKKPTMAQTTATDSAPPAPQKRQKSQKPRPKGKRKKSMPPLLKQFAACGRCSFFWAGYKLIDENFDERMAEPTNGWVTLLWNRAVRELVYKSFGNRVDLDFYHYEGCCSACQRPFIFQNALNDKTPARLRIRL